MDQPPPEINPPPLEAPPQQYAAYYRGPTGYQGEPAKLEALGSGYFGLNKAFLLHMVLALLVVYGLPALLISQNVTGLIGLVVFLAAFVLYIVAVVFITLPPVRKVAFGMGWASSSVIISEIGILLLGLIAYIVLQTVASSEMKKYGVKWRLFGVRKRDVASAVQALRTNEAQYTAPPPAQS